MKKEIEDAYKNNPDVISVVDNIARQLKMLKEKHFEAGSIIIIPNNDDITPEYIVDQVGKITREELICLIENYGSQESDKGSYSNDPKFQ